MNPKFQLTVQSYAHDGDIVTNEQGVFQGNNGYENRQLAAAMNVSSEHCATRHAFLSSYTEGGLPDGGMV